MTGQQDPGVMVETFGTEKVRRDEIERFVDERFDLRPGAIRETLELQRPIYSWTAACHFGRDDPRCTWEDTGRARF
jgi:S-adenosylmethionine synthetase